MNYIVGENRNQIQMIALEQLVAPDSWARVIDLFVDILPIDELGFKHVKLQSEGRPPYNPVTLLKLYLYGYKHSIRSSRKLEHSCKVNVELWWLLGGLMPSFRTIAYFRKNNAEAFRKVFRQFVLMLKDMGLIEGETIGIDSFKIFAQNSLRNNYTQKKIDRHLEYIDKRIKDFEAALDETDKEEEKELLESKIKLQQDRRKKYETLNTELKNSNDTQVSLTDKDSRALMLTNNVSGVGYAVQAASDSKHKLLVHSHIGASTDKRELSTAALTVQELLQLDSFNTLSDAGYTSGDQLQACKYSGICTYSSPMPSTSPNSNSIPLAEFHYINDGDYYICPCGEQMTTTGKWRSRPNYRSKVYKTSACVNCSIREKCTQNQNGRVIERSEYQDIIDENNARVIGNRNYYKLRQQIIEHQFGILKRQWGFTYTLMKGKANVLSEVNIFMTIYNLTRCITIMGMDELKRRLKAFLPLVSLYMSLLLIKDEMQKKELYLVI